MVYLEYIAGEDGYGTIYARDVLASDAGNTITVEAGYGYGFDEAFNDATNPRDLYGTYRIADNSNISSLRNQGNFVVTTLVTDMSSLFYSYDYNQVFVDTWDVSNVTTMESMFEQAVNFNKHIGSWDVSNVTNMSRMFVNANSFSRSLENWDVSNVTDMNRMFSFASNFNQDIGNWDVSNVTNMSYMFNFSSKFNQDIGNWDVSSVTDMSYMFSNSIFNQNINTKEVNVNGNTYTAWNVSIVTNMEGMFSNLSWRGSYAKFNQDIGNWDVSSVTNMKQMFSFTDIFNQDIGNWNVSNVINMAGMFKSATVFNQNIRYWTVNTTTNINNIFFDATDYLDGEYGTTTGYIDSTGNINNNDILSYFNQPIPEASTYGDPHINTLHGETYELPNKENVYRMLQGNDLIINASVSKLSTKETNEIVRYFHNAGVLNEQYLRTMMVKGVYYNHVYINTEGETLEYNFRSGEMKMSSYKKFKLSKTIKENDALYGDKHQLSDKICQINIEFYHSKYGKISVDLNHFSNPQTRYGLGLNIKKCFDLSGLLVREYKVKTMRLNKLRDILKKDGKLGKNKVHSNFLIIKRPTN